MNWRSVLVNTEIADVLRATDPPENLPTEIVTTLNESTPEHLQDIATYAEELAEHKEREAHLEEKSDDTTVEKRPDDLPDDVPAKATITIKESTV